MAAQTSPRLSVTTHAVANQCFIATILATTPFAMTAGAASVPALVWNPMTASIVTRVNSGGMARPPAIRPLTKPAATAGTTPRLSRRTRKMAFARSSRRRRRADASAEFGGGLVLRSPLEQAQHHGIAEIIRQTSQFVVQ